MPTKRWVIHPTEEKALQNANFLQKNMRKEDGGLWRNYKDGKAVINAFLDDYAIVIQAFTALYEITFDEKWLQEADALVSYVQQHFLESSTAMFFYTSDEDPPLVTRRREKTDNVIPASNSIMARNLARLGTLLYKPDYLTQAKQMLANMEEEILDERSANYYTNWGQLWAELLNPPYEVAIMGENYDELRAKLQQEYLPNVLFLGGEKEGTMALLRDKLQEGETLIYVCQNKVCKFPVDNVAAALEQLGR